jgi:hypothetical protein
MQQINTSGTAIYVVPRDSGGAVIRQGGSFIRLSIEEITNLLETLKSFTDGPK